MLKHFLSQKKMIIFSVLIAIVTGGWVTFLFLDEPASGTDQSSEQTSLSAASRSEKVVRHFSNIPSNEHKKNLPQSSKDNLAEKELYTSLPIKKNRGNWWYRQPVLATEDKFVESYTDITLDSGCSSGSALDASTSIEQNFYDHHNLDLTTRLPEDLFYFTLTQFWQLRDEHFQFVAIWDRDMPALYRYEFYRSRDPKFENSVEPIDLPVELPAIKDVLNTNHFVRQLIRYFNEAGANTGARILESSINGVEGDQQITLVNSQLTRWHTKQFSCDLDNNNSSYCNCDANRHFGEH
ncbi:hypothetical protein FLL45_01695 [Aliikangiella marina]|uniref:Uncharacterized protein n=1 Tax=Aliikangiella marina TaxID=1712262 RepID=A0A545THJ4_9GAMM|nr:hypothetical protein [Aliikangiella marina]TQV76699.1 hypothetical protein FLL45_01695 [Aliikangiella marina]